MLAMLKEGGAQQISFLPKGGGGYEKLYAVLRQRGGGPKCFSPAIFLFCTPPPPPPLTNRRYLGAFHLVRTHLEGEGVQVSNTFPLRITCKKGGGGPDSMQKCVPTKWKTP